MALGEARDLAGDGRGEERGLALLLQGAEDLVQVVGEAHVEHLVGLVQDDGLDLVEAERAAVEVVHGPAGSGDDDVHAAGQAGELRGDGLAAVDGDDAHAEVPAVAVDRLGDLHRELPRGREDERRRPAATAVAGDAAAVDGGAGLAGLVHAAGEVLEDRQGEGGGLAGAGGGLGEQVAAREQGRDRRLLDGRGLLVAETGEGALEPLVEVEGGEAGGHEIGGGSGFRCGLGHLIDCGLGRLRGPLHAVGVHGGSRGIGGGRVGDGCGSLGGLRVLVVHS